MKSLPIRTYLRELLGFIMKVLDEFSEVTGLQCVLYGFVLSYIGCENKEVEIYGCAKRLWG